MPLATQFSTVDAEAQILLHSVTMSCQGGMCVVMIPGDTLL
jgi:hypothetical protein